MKKFNKNSTVALIVMLAVFFMLVALGLTGTKIARAATTPSLEAAATYGILGNLFQHNIAATTITGDPATPTAGVLGYSSEAGVGAMVVVNGITNVNNAAWTSAGIAQNAALNNAVDGLKTQACTSIGAIVDLASYDTDGAGGLSPGTFPPGCYSSTGAMSIGGGATVTLSGSGTYIFRPGDGGTGALTTTASSKVVLSGASACDVFWAPTAATTLGANSTFVGTIIDPSGVTMSNLAAVTGRILAYGGTVTADSNSITLPICAAATATLTLIKTITNDNGGARPLADFSLTATGPTTITGVSGTAPVTAATVTIGTYTLSETTQADYTSGLWSCTNGIAVNGSSQIILSAGQSTVCTINNNDNAPSLHLRKTVTNDNGGTALNTAWTLTATGALGSPTNLTGTTPVDSGATFKADTYTLAESGGPVGYTASTYSCVKNGGGAVVSNTITLAAGDDATCTITNNDIAPQLTATKVVVNDNGGTKVISDFSLFINGMSVTSGIASTTSVGSYTVSETSDSGYTSAITGNCAANGTITLALGDIKICTITNDDIAPPVGGSVVSVPRVPPLIEVVKVPSPLALPAGSGSVTYTYTLRNIGTVPVTSVTMVDDSCSPATLVSGDTNTDTKLDTSEVWIYRCSMTLSQTHTNTVVATGWANNISATDIASATIVVGAPVVPPLIHVIKIPNPLALPAGGGMVTYTKRITNPGTVALSNVLITDDKCNPINYISGDINGDSKLDPNETWEYTCRSSLTKTTTNTAIVTGEANGLTARDFAIATVVVAAAVPGVTTPVATVVPKLPDTGIAPTADIIVWPIIAAGILAILLLLYVIRKKQII